MADINLGDSYSIDEDSNGDLIIRHDPSGDEIKYDSANNGFVGDNFNSIETERVNNTVHITSGDAAEVSEKIASHGSHTRYKIHRSPDGPYVFDGSNLIHTVPSNIEIVGVGGPTFELGDNVKDDIIRPALDASGEPTENVLIEGIVFDGNEAENPRFDPWDPDGDGQTEIKGTAAIRPINAKNWTIQNCVVHSWSRFGICIKLSHNITVRDVEAYDCTDDGITTSNQFFDSQNLSNILIENCNCYQNTDQGIEIEDGSTDVIIRDCVSENNGTGITVKGHTGEAANENVHIVDCTIRNNQDSGIALQSGPSGEQRGRYIRGCHIEGNGSGELRLGTVVSSNVAIKDVHVSDTTCVLSGGSSRAVFQAKNRLQNASIDVNVRVLNGVAASDGLDLEGPMKGVDIRASVDSSQGTLNNGITLNSGQGAIEDVTVDAFVEGAEFAGLQLAPGADPLTHVEVTGTFKNNGQDTGAANTRRNGIRVRSGVTDSKFTHVTAYDDQSTKTQRNGIHIDGGDYNLYTDCILRGNAVNAISGTVGANDIETDNIK